MQPKGAPGLDRGKRTPSGASRKSGTPAVTPVPVDRHKRYRESFDGWLNQLAGAAAGRSRRRNANNPDRKPHSTDLDKIRDVIERLIGTCMAQGGYAIVLHSGGKIVRFKYPLTFAPGSLFTASPDRLDESKGYTDPGNVVLVPQWFNTGRSGAQTFDQALEEAIAMGAAEVLGQLTVSKPTVH